MLRSRAWISVLASAAMLWFPTPGLAKKKNPKGPTVVTPEQAPTPADDDLSRGGTRRGILEYSLGGVTAAVSVALIAFGSVQFYRAQQIQAFCDQPATFDSPECSSLLGNPVLNARISGGLSLGFSIPLAIASGFLFRRAFRIHRDYKTYSRKQAKVSWAPTGSPGQIGGVLMVRF